MLKKTIIRLTIFSLLVATIGNSAFAQTKDQQLRLNESAAASTKNQPKPDFKKIFAAETEKFAADSARFDPVKDSISQNKQQAKRKWTKKDTLITAAVIVAVAAILFVVIKYGKDCLRSSPAGCTPGVDEYCTCEEYEVRNP